MDSEKYIEIIVRMLRNMDNDAIEKVYKVILNMYIKKGR